MVSALVRINLAALFKSQVASELFNTTEEKFVEKREVNLVT
jgi:hypothetical protein